jgi:hypothetical protein
MAVLVAVPLRSLRTLGLLPVICNMSRPNSPKSFPVIEPPALIALFFAFALGLPLVDTDFTGFTAGVDTTSPAAGAGAAKVSIVLDSMITA